MSLAGKDDYPGCWKDASKDWPFIRFETEKEIERAFVAAGIEKIIPYGSFVRVDMDLRLETEEYKTKLLKHLSSKYLITRRDAIINHSVELFDFPAKAITWKQLQKANIHRLPQFKNSKGELAHNKPDGSDWSPAQWLQAIMGELGEYANERKKFERGDIDLTEFKLRAGHELADVVIYLSLLALQLGIDMDKEVIEKFNIVSERVGATTFLTPEGKILDIKD